MSQANESTIETCPENPQFRLEQGAAEEPAWTEVEAGRFMPRRIRGSFQGRALG